MSDASQNYISSDIRSGFRNQAFHVWLIASAIVFLWLAMIVAAPSLLANGLNAASAPVYTFFSYVCHQIPERSLYIAGHQLAVCSRCFGVYAGLLFGILIYPLWRHVDEIEPIPRFWLFLSLVPITIDWSLTIFGIWENSHFSRFVTGLILGAVCATFIVPALVEIVRNISHKTARAQ